MLFRDHYEVTQDGEIYSYISNRWLKQSTSHYGYKFVNLLGAPTLIHRAVSLCYLPNPEGKKFVNHKDGNKTHNFVSNLEWVTNAENMKHGWSNGLMKRGSKHGQAKFSDEDIHEICRLISAGFSASEVAGIFGEPLNRNRVLDIRARRSWVHISKDYLW